MATTPPFFLPRARLAAAALLAALAACDGGSTDSTPRIPARMDVVSGNAQTADPGAELAQPLVVRVVDDKDRPVRGQIVNFVVTEGGGSIFAGAALTNDDGEARERWRLGTAPGQKLEARAVDAATGQAVVFATFTARLTGEGVPATLSQLAPAGTGPYLAPPGSPLADSLTVNVRDRYGWPVPGATVAWTADNGAAVSPAVSTTSASGVAKTRLTLGTAAGVTYTAAATVAGLGPLQFRAQVLAPVSIHAIYSQPQLEDPRPVSGQPLTLRAHVLGPGFAPVPGAAVTFAAVSGGGSVSPAQAVTDAQGYAQTVLTAGPAAGLNEITATVSGLPPATFHITTIAAVPFGSVRVSPDTLRLSVGGVNTLHAVVLDAGGTVVPPPGPIVSYAPTQFSFGWTVRVPGFLDSLSLGEWHPEISRLRLRATAPGQGWVVGRLTGVPYWVTGFTSPQADSTYVIVQ